MTQTDRLNKIRLWASERGIVLLRNNNGMLEDKDGRKIRYGLMVGSSDLIGWKSVVVTAGMVGRRIAIFIGVEDKSVGDIPTEQQLRWQSAVNQAGGIAVIVTSVEELEGVL